MGVLDALPVAWMGPYTPYEFVCAVYNVNYLEETQHHIKTTIDEELHIDKKLHV